MVLPSSKLLGNQQGEEEELEGGKWALPPVSAGEGREGESCPRG